MKEILIIRLAQDKYSRRIVYRYDFREDYRLLDLVRNCHEKFCAVQNSHYNLTEVASLEAALNEFQQKLDLRQEQDLMGLLYPWNRYYHDLHEYSASFKMIQEMNDRLKVFHKKRLYNNRKFEATLGDFGDSISPKMIHSLLSWLKTVDPKYNGVRRGIKENILTQLRELGLVVDAGLLCDFIDKVSPISFLKEWRVPMYADGKRQTNQVLRELLKTQFYERERNYLRTFIAQPHIRRLPRHIEKKIQSYI